MSHLSCIISSSKLLNCKIVGSIEGVCAADKDVHWRKLMFSEIANDLCDDWNKTKENYN